MHEEVNEFDKLSDTYFSQPFEERTLKKVLDYLSKTILIVQSYPGYIDEFEDVNLQVQQAVNIPETSDGYKFLQTVHEELLGYEDLEAVLGSKQKATDAMQDWCEYITEVVSKGKAGETNSEA